MCNLQEIGGNFCIEQNNIDQKVNSFDKILSSYAGEKAFLSNGRGALNLILSRINLTKKKVLLPIYTCESVVKPFLINDYDIEYFDIKTNLAIDETDLRNKITDFKPSVVLYHSYFGFNTLDDTVHIFDDLHKNGVILIEDITHRLFSRFQSTKADYFIGSLRKWFGIPDGAVIFSSNLRLNSTVDKLPSMNKVIELFEKASVLKSIYLTNPEPKLKERFRSLFYEAEEIIDRDYNSYRINVISKKIIENYGYDFLKERRRENFLFLLENFPKSAFVKPIFEELPSNVVPLYFPIYVYSNRNKLQKFLAKNLIYAPIHWPKTDLINVNYSYNYKAINERILSIPCDQRYCSMDMSRIIENLNSYLRRNNT